MYVIDTRQSGEIHLIQKCSKKEQVRCERRIYINNQSNIKDFKSLIQTLFITLANNIRERTQK